MTHWGLRKWLIFCKQHFYINFLQNGCWEYSYGSNSQIIVIILKSRINERDMITLHYFYLILNMLKLFKKASHWQSVWKKNAQLICNMYQYDNNGKQFIIQNIQTTKAEYQQQVKGYFTFGITLVCHLNKSTRLILRFKTNWGSVI